MTDRRILYAAAFLRALATGSIGVTLGLYLAALRFDPRAIGAIVSLGLAGGALATLVVTLSGDGLARRRTLAALGLLGATGGVGLALASDPWAAAAAAFLGMVNGMGRDRGASLALEQAVLPATAPAALRTRSFAWYSLLQDLGHALGGLAAALPQVIQSVLGLGETPALRASVGLYATLVLVTALLPLALSPAIEPDPRTAKARARRAPVSAESRRVLWRICALFGLDGLGGGFLTTALLSLFFLERFGADPAAIGALFFAARLANMLSHLGAAWLASRIGLVRTMVFTHVPSNLLLVGVALTDSFPLAAALFLLRESLVEMDVPTRQSYVMAVVRPEERTFASGVTHLVRLASWAVAPVFVGLLMQQGALVLPLIVGAAIKLAYDGLLWLAFRSRPPPEERAAA